jgi:hypothetical protein
VLIHLDINDAGNMVFELSKDAESVYMMPDDPRYEIFLDGKKVTTFKVSYEHFLDVVKLFTDYAPVAERFTQQP